MKNKLLFLCSIVITITLNCSAFQFSNSVQVTSNLTFFLNGEKSYLPQFQFKSDEAIFYTLVANPLTPTNLVHYFALPFDETFAFKMLDDKNREVKKNERGFANSKEPNLIKNRNDTRKLKPRPIGYEPYFLFRPDEMFMITNKGVYELDVRIRICVPMTNGVPDTKAMTSLHGLLMSTNFNVVVSDPVRVRIIKE